MKTTVMKSWLRVSSCAVGLLLVLSSIGCQSTYNGQTLPSPYYATDDVQYFAPGPEFKLAREAANAQAYRADLQQQAP